MVISFDTSSLLSYYQARQGQTASTAVGSTTSGDTTKTQYAPTPPWSTTSAAARSSALVKAAMAGHRFVDEGAAQLDLKGASSDYKKLFALYQGLNTLHGLAERMQATGVSATEKTRLQAIFSRGMGEISSYTDTAKLEQMRLTRGETMITNKTAVGVPRSKYSYATGKIYTGQQADAVPAFQGAVAFTISVKRGTVTHTINIDLADMGGATRTMGAVTSFINSKLEAEGLQTRFSVERTASPPRTVTTGGTTVTLPSTTSDFAFKITGDSTETATFSAPTTKPAVYVTTYAGNPDPDKNVKTEDGVFETSLVKLDGDTVGAEGSRIFSGTLEGTISTVRTSKVGPDGSLYVLADVATSIDGQTVKGAKDVALLKYDSTGQLMYARTLGAAENAEGLAMTVSSDGRVAIAGKVTGALAGVTNGPINSGADSTLTDSFVTVFDAKGDEEWTARRGALKDDEATAVAFGAGGIVYVAGRAKSVLPTSGATAMGDYDSYLTAFAPDAKGVPKALFTTQFGTAGADTVSGIVVDGAKVTLAGVENGHGVLRSFDVTPTTTETVRTDDNGHTNITVTNTTNGVPTVTSTDYGAHDGGTDPVVTTTTNHTSAASFTAGATRDLGDLEGGSILGIGLDGGDLWIGGSTRNGALTLAGSPTHAYSDGLDAFATRISTDLSSTSRDALTYFGGTGNDTVNAVAVSGGKVWVAGQASADMPGSAAIATKDGFLAQLDVLGGTSVVHRLTGKDGIATATSIAVDSSGASALDKLGLPKGALLYADSTKVASATSARAGDSFQIRTAEGGRLATVTLEAGDTLETLATKVRRAAGSKAKVEIVSDGDFRRLKITPATKTSTVEVLPGKGGLDFIGSIGLTPGVIRNTIIDKNGKSVSADGGGPVFGLGLPAELDVSDDKAIKNALAVLGKSLGKVRDAYRQLEAAARPETVTSKTANGPVPAYLTNQISNYQAALDRLGGG
ncbi:MAG: hypothetical protein HY859_07005 [Caulobacterales bacterium]|nr:hypothetical protein [Caulobacterales bacterium]